MAAAVADAAAFCSLVDALVALVAALFAEVRALAALVAACWLVPATVSTYNFVAA